MADQQIKILLAAGGTGGHVYPAIAIADAIKEEQPSSEILFVGTRNHMEWKAVPKAGYNIKNVWISGFHRRMTPKNLLFPLKLVTSLVQSFSILGRFKPQVVVSCGGYAAGPVGWMAAQRNIPVVIQEQNSFPGVTNRLLGRSAERIFTAFEDAAEHFPAGKITLSGNPTRSSLKQASRENGLRDFDFTADKPVLLVLGGSGGAKSINDAMAAHVKELHDEQNIQIIWQCGAKYYDEMSTAVQPDSMENLRLKAYLDNMPEAYAAADLVLSRAGASSCSELMLTGKPSILVPSPYVAGDHQTKNARSMVESGASEILKDSDMKETLTDLVERLITDQEKLRKMNEAALKLAKPKAAKLIAREILEIAQARLNKQN